MTEDANQTFQALIDEYTFRRNARDNYGDTVPVAAEPPKNASLGACWLNPIDHSFYICGLSPDGEPFWHRVGPA